MTKSRVFISNRSQAVRLPKAFEFPPEIRDVAVRAVGRKLIVSPAVSSWDDFFETDGVDLGPRATVPQRRRRKP